MDIGANRRACARKLIGHAGTFGCSYTVNKVNDSDSKLNGEIK